MATLTEQAGESIRELIKNYTLYTFHIYKLGVLGFWGLMVVDFGFAHTPISTRFHAFLLGTDGKGDCNAVRIATCTLQGIGQ